MARSIHRRGVLMPFAPKGEIAQWRIIYQLFKAAPTGEAVSYETLAQAIDVDPERERHRVQAAARRAGPQLLATDDRAIEVIPDVGYRVVDAVRQVSLAGQQVERAGRSLDRGRDLTTHIRMDELSENERAIAQTMALGFAQVAEWARQIGRRFADHEDRLSDVEAELARLRDQSK